MKRAKATRNRNQAPMGLTEVDIKVGLLRRGIRQTDIAAACKVSRATVNQVIKKKIRSHRIEEYIKQVILGEVAA